MKLIYNFFFCLLIFTLTIQASFESLWQQMQINYRKLYEITEKDDAKIALYCHQQWEISRSTLRDIILGKPNKDFLRASVISGTMVRSGFSYPQLYETTYLQHCISDKTRQLLMSIKDTHFGELKKECLALDCSTNTLGHLFYLCRIIEAIKNDIPKKLIEIGGGYGNFACLISQAIPDITLVLFDIPEMIALQWLFLSITTQKEIIIHNDPIKIVEDGAIHLLPINFIDEISGNVDIFISTFALSECSKILQEKIIEKDFFNAQLCYITGQLNGWGNKFSFENHTTIIDAIRKKYENVVSNPFHFFCSDQMSYEILAK